MAERIGTRADEHVPIRSLASGADSRLARKAAGLDEVQTRLARLQTGVRARFRPKKA